MRGDYRPDLGEVPDNEEPQGKAEIVLTQIERQPAVIRDMKGRYHEMANRIGKLEAKLESIKRLTPKPPDAITYDQGVEILNMVQQVCWSDCSG